MLRGVSATPCPVQERDPILRRDSFFIGGENTTTLTNIDFTRANVLTAAKPRRRQTNVNARRVVIHEDESARHVGGEGKRVQAGGSLLAKPVKRVKGRVSFAANANLDVGGQLVGLGSISEGVVGDKPIDDRLSQPPKRRVSVIASGMLKGSVEEPTLTHPFHFDQDVKEKKLAKPPRRGTIYIPSDDTTMPSMYMGIFSPIKDELHEEPEEEVEVTGIAAQMAKRRGRRSSLAAEPARRVGPLRSALGSIREQHTNVKTEDDRGRIGMGGGKENFPPGYRRQTIGKTMTQGLTEPAISAACFQRSQRPMPQVSAAWKASAEARKPAWNSGFRPRADKPTEAPARPVPARPGRPGQGQELAVPPKVPSRFVIPKVQHQEQPLQEFPPLSEDISNPAMYEDNWLTHQEIAITQLVSNLFSSAKSQEPPDPTLLRIELLDLYATPSFSLLHKRLQGSILYGALRVPNDMLSTASRLRDDLGLRKSFVDLWYQNYEPLALRAALEVVIGRQCTSSPRALQSYVEAFLIRNEDGLPEVDCADVAAWSYRRTILRSLMLIKLLDQAKSADILTEPLFLSSSMYKTSVGVLQALAQTLNPTMGLRPLSYLDFIVSHIQQPLEEFQYTITNLATDLRDGVRLTRLVELLLYPSASRCLARDRDEDGAMTLSMPTGEILSMLDGQQEWPLSQHLKFPCLGRATKLYNVQIALTALQGVRGVEKIVHDIRAEDIVDGYREKTVALLWGLTGKWGMGSLVEWKDVRQEIRRLHKSSGRDQLGEDDEEDLCALEHNLVGYKTLLQAWASAVACRRGLGVNNLSTSFADGRVFEAIVDEYEDYLHDVLYSTSSSRRAPLHERLTKLGCSVQFSSLFAPSDQGGATRTQIFDRDFTAAALAFLCSRLLSASKRPRATILIQRAWRARQGRLHAHQQQIARRLAVQCAEVVRTRERIMQAKGTIWKWWKSHQTRGSGSSRTSKLTGGGDEEETDAGDLWLSL